MRARESSARAPGAGPGRTAGRSLRGSVLGLATPSAENSRSQTASCGRMNRSQRRDGHATILTGIVSQWRTTPVSDESAIPETPTLRSKPCLKTHRPSPRSSRSLRDRISKKAARGKGTVVAVSPEFVVRRHRAEDGRRPPRRRVSATPRGTSACSAGDMVTVTHHRPQPGGLLHALQARRSRSPRTGPASQAAFDAERRPSPASSAAWSRAGSASTSGCAPSCRPPAAAPGSGRDGEAGRPGDPVQDHQAGCGRRGRGGGPARRPRRGREARPAEGLRRIEGRRGGRAAPSAR